jgi:hypothetical protein
MQSGGSRRAGCAAGRWYEFGAITAMVVGLAVSGCTTTGQPTAAMRGATIAFDSIDGPPAGVFEQLVHNLGEEAQARRLAVVSREAPSHYRVRGYLAAHIARGRTSIAWVWDVYDAADRRMLRISGEEPAGRNRRDAWHGADEAVLRRIARASVGELVAFLGAPAPAPVFEPEPAAERAIALAAAEP